MKALSEGQIAIVTRRAGALSDPTRLRILEQLHRRPQAVGQIAAALAVPQSTVSRHLQVLFMAGLVHRQRDASAVIYSSESRELLEWCRRLAAPRLRSGTPAG